MMAMRIYDHPVLDDITEEPIHFYFNGRRFAAYEGDTVASALMAGGVRTLRVHEVSGRGVGIYCNIGHCFECRVRVGHQVRRACLTPVTEGMTVYSLGAAEEGGDG